MIGVTRHLDKHPSSRPGEQVIVALAAVAADVLLSLRRYLRAVAAAGEPVDAETLCWYRLCAGGDLTEVSS